MDVDLTMHFVALNEILVIFQVSGRVCDVRPDVVIQVPAEVLIRDHEQQSIQVVCWSVSMYIQSAYIEEKMMYKI